MRPCGRYRLAGEQHFHCLFARNIARKRHHRRRAKQAYVDARGGECRGFGRDRKIAACDDLASRGGGDALYRCYYRFGQVHDRLHHCAAGVHDMREVGAAAIGIGATGGHLLHIVAGGKSRAIGRDHHRSDAFVVVNVG